MTDSKPGWRSKLPVVFWLTSVTLLAAVKIIVGAIYVNGGCLGFSLFPYFLLIGGILGLVPSVVAVIVTFTPRQSRDLNDMWDSAAKLFFFIVAFLLAGTIYTLVNSVKATHLNRLCTDSWVVVFGLCVMVLDWTLFAAFFRLFCVNTVPPQTKPVAFEQEYFSHDQSPFYMWKNRRNFNY